MKIIHFADLHLGMENFGRIDPKTGLNSRLSDYLDSFDFLVDYAIKEKVDLVIFSGDAYKTREPNPTYQREFARRIRKISQAGIPVVLIVGNHDSPIASGKADTLEIFPTLGVENVFVSRKPEIINIEGIQVATFPWMYKSQLLSADELKGKNLDIINQFLQKRISEKIDYLASKIDPKKPAILAAHLTAEGATFGSERQVMLGSDIVVPLKVLANKKFDYVALGHLHAHQELSKRPPIIYSGSIERVDFGEEKEAKGFILVELKTKNEKVKNVNYKFIETPARKFKSIKINISENDPDPMKAILEKIKKEKIANAVIKIIIETPEEKLGEIREMPIVEALRNAYFIAGINKEIKSGQRVKEVEGFSEELTSLETLDVLDKYLTSKKVSREHIQKLHQAAQKLIEETEE